MNQHNIEVGDKVRVTKNPYTSVTFTGKKEVKAVYWSNDTGACIGVQSDNGGGPWTIFTHQYEVVSTKPVVRTEFNSLDDFYSGMKVVLRNGWTYIVLKDAYPTYTEYDFSVALIGVQGGFLTKEDFEGLKCHGGPSLDIVEVYTPSSTNIVYRGDDMKWALVWEEKKSEAQARIDELEATIQAAAKQIEELKTTL